MPTPTAIYRRCTCGAIFITHDVASSLSMAHDHALETYTAGPHRQDEAEAIWTNPIRVVIRKGDIYALAPYTCTDDPKHFNP